MTKIIRALDILERKWKEDKISTEEYDDRMFAICAWAKNRIFRDLLKSRI